MTWGNRRRKEEVEGLRLELALCCMSSNAKVFIAVCASPVTSPYLRLGRRIRIFPQRCTRWAILKQSPAILVQHKFSHCDDCRVSCSQFDFSFPTQRMKISTFLDVVATSRSQPKQISLCLESVWARQEGRVLNLERVSAVSIPFRHARAGRTPMMCASETD